MPNQLKCNFCDKPATVHFTQIVNNKAHKVDLCEACAQAKGITDSSGFSFSDLLMKGVAGMALASLSPDQQAGDGSGAADNAAPAAASPSGSPASVAASAFASSTSGLRCEKCGFTQADFKKQGRFGCPHCYETFAPTLAPMLDAMHKGATHTGKVPRHALARKTYHDRLSQLEHSLTDAIKTERYEDAARYRDEITKIKQTHGQQS